MRYRNGRIRGLISLALLGVALGAASAPPSAPTGLLVDLNPAPLGVESAAPKFSWIVNDPDKDEIQSAYQIVISGLHTPGSSRLSFWDSGMVVSNASSNVEYTGAPLAPGEAYAWRVRTWDKEGNEGAWSAPQTLVTALKDRWAARPIWSAAGDFAYLRKTVTLPSRPIVSAYAFVTGRDTRAIRQYVYRLQINGQFVGVGPARGFGGKVPYNVFDVTRLLRPGKPNALAALCGSRDTDKDFMLQLAIRYADGRVENIVTDATWKALDASPIYNMTKNYSVYKTGPENIDATKIPAGWMAPEFDDTAWAAATLKPEYKAALAAQPMRNIEAGETAPVKRIDKGNGKYLLDFGKECLGGIKLTVNGKAGGKVRIRLGEELGGPDEVRYQLRALVDYEETWTLAGGPQTIENWGYRGFRYAELAFDPPAADPGFQAGVTALHYPFDDRAAEFSSSDPGLNKVWAFCKYSIKATALDVYQDCPTRERCPYEGDAYINQLSHYAMDREFTLPRYSAEYLYAVPTWPTEYKQLSVMQAWEDYQATGNKDSLARSYGILKTKTMEDRINADGLIEEPLNKSGKIDKGDLVDWPESYRDGYRMTAINTVINAFNCKALSDLVKIAGVLGKNDERAAYVRKFLRLHQAINARFYDPATSRYADGAGTSHTAAHASFFPLALGITPPAERAKVGAYLKTRGMACGVYGSQFLLEALYEAGEDEAALKLMTARGANSWLHLIDDLGATVVTEAWDPAGKSDMSFAHAWASAPANIIARRLMGISPLKPGYASILIRPQTGGLNQARIAVPTLKGTVRVEFIDEGKTFTLKVSIPANTRALVELPLARGYDERAAAQPAVAIDGRPLAGGILIKNGRIHLLIGSGEHTIVRN